MIKVNVLSEENSRSKKIKKKNYFLIKFVTSSQKNIDLLTKESI